MVENRGISNRITRNNEISWPMEGGKDITVKYWTQSPVFILGTNFPLSQIFISSNFASTSVHASCYMTRKISSAILLPLLINSTIRVARIVQAAFCARLTSPIRKQPLVTPTIKDLQRLSLIKLVSQHTTY